MKTLEDTLHEITPAPDPGFVEEMERRMQMGFPPKQPPRFVRPSLALPSFRRPAFAGAVASALLALVVSLAIVNDDDVGRQTTGPDQPIALDAREVAPTEDLVGDSDASGGSVAMTPLPTTVLPEPIPPPDGDVAPGRRDRKVELTAQLSLAASTDEFDGIADSVFAIAQRRNGFVLHSSFTEAENGASGGFFELRVPAAQLQSTLNELSRLATVRARTESGTDVTGAFVGARDRLQMARAERKSLLTRLENAETDRAAQAIRARLEIVAREIANFRSQLRGMRERTTYAAVSVELVDKDSEPAAAPTETGEAWDDAVGSLEDILNFLIRTLGILVPVTLAAALGWLAVTRGRKRARERTLA